MTEDEIARKHKNTQAVPRRNSEDKSYSQFEVTEVANQLGNENAIANVAMGHFDNSPVTNHYYTGSPENQKKDIKYVLREKMEKWYKKRAQLPQVPWLKKMECVNILRNYDVTLIENETKNKIPIPEIFQEPCKRILIESPPGFGKTTLAMKMAYDWARKEEYLKQFDFVFVLLLRELRDCNIEDTIHSFIKQLMSSSITVDDINEILKNKEILLILDGYDELTNSEIKRSVNDILYRDEDETEHFTVLTTCRTGMFKTDRSIFGFARRRLFCDKKFDIDGLSEDQMKKLLEHILDKQHVSQVFTEIINIEKQFRDIHKCPLYVMMIAFLQTKQATLDIGMGRTKFYKKMMNALVNSHTQSASSKPNQISCENIFESQANCNEIKNYDLVNFGKLCWELITKSEFAFARSELITTMYKVGFLTESENFLSEDSVYHYKPIHRSFAEFFAAYYLFQEIQNSNEKRLPNETIEMLTKQFALSRGTTLIHSFLLGFLGEESHILFNQLKPHAYVYSQIEAGFWSMLVDCSNKEELTESLNPFIPISVGRRGDRSISNEMFDIVIRKGLQNNRIETVRIRLDVCQSCELSSGLCIDRILLRVFQQNLQTNIDGKSTLFANADIRCNNLIIQFNGKYDNDDHNRKSIIDLFKLILSVKFNSLSIDAEENSTCRLLNESIMADESLGKFEIYSFHCLIRDQDSNWIKFLSSLIMRNNLIRLHLVFKIPVPFTALKQITINAENSENLNALRLRNDSASPFYIDLGDLITNSKHKWRTISIDRFQINVKKSFPENTDVTFLLLFPSNDYVPNIGNSAIKSLYCHSSFLLKIQDSKDFPSTLFKNTLQDITVQFNNASMTRRHLSKIEEFAAIKKFAIDLCSSISTIPEKLFDVLKLMEIEHLEIWFDEANEKAAESFILTFTTFLSRREKGDNLSIERICLFIKSNNLLISKTMLNQLLKCLEEKRLKTVSIIRRKELESEPYYFHWIDVGKFDFNYRLTGNKVVDMEIWKNKFLDNLADSQLDITLH